MARNVVGEDPICRTEHSSRQRTYSPQKVKQAPPNSSVNEKQVMHEQGTNPPQNGGNVLHPTDNPNGVMVSFSGFP